MTDTLFAGSIAEIYDDLLVPIWFTPFARDLAERIAAANPRTVLETCAGTGALTREIAARLPGDARIVATDLNQPMLDRWSDTRVTSKQADALALPFDDASFDVVACQFGAMFFPDRVRGYDEARRVLVPGGTLLFNVWDALATNELADAVTRALAEVFPNDPPRFFERVPYGYHDVARIRDDLERAQLTDVAIDAVDLPSRAQSPLEAAVAICQGTPLRSEIESRDASALEPATQHTAAALATRFGSGSIETRMRAFVVRAKSVTTRAPRDAPESPRRTAP